MSEQSTAPDITEAIKLGFEAMKQLTTLNAGSIVVIGTFLSNIFPTDNQGTLTVPLYVKILIGLAFVGFGVSLFFSALTMHLYRESFESHLYSRVGRTPSQYDPADIAKRRFKPLPIVFFTGGLICFSTAVLLNLFFGS
jgi:hypothetical protein